MEALINISYNANTKEKLTVSARELYEFLEIKTEFAKWCSRMFEYGFEEGKDFSSFLTKSTVGRPQTDYALTINTAKEIAMIQRTEKGKQARQYFLECERNLHNQSGQISQIVQAVQQIGERLDKLEARGNVNTTAEASTAVVVVDSEEERTTKALALIKEGVKLFKDRLNPVGICLPVEVVDAFPKATTLATLCFVSEVFKECRSLKGRYTKCNQTIQNEFGIKQNAITDSIKALEKAGLIVVDYSKHQIRTIKATEKAKMAFFASTSTVNKKSGWGWHPTA